MSKVHLLSAGLISKIAAGEVIERPSSVIKELAENSIDAGASTIEVALKQSGKELIRVKDDGCGIEPDDMGKIFSRHCTSKISSEEELEAISTLGFRGEALYSVSSVSDITLSSKTAGQKEGWRIQLRGGEKVSLEPVAMNPGTDIHIRELFFNTPARKKFLKSDSSELNHALSVLTPYCLLYPQKRFLLSNNAKAIFDLEGVNSLTKRAAKALNLPEKNLIEAQKDFPQQGLKLRLLLGDINVARANREAQFIFVNGRPVQSRNISFNLNQVYRLIFTPQAHPFFALFIEVDPRNVDVNVHPTKREVKLKDEQMIISLLRQSCERLLMTKGAPKEVLKFTVQPQEIAPSDSHSPQENTPLITAPAESQLIISQSAQDSEIFRTAQDVHLQDSLRDARFIGSFLKTYLLYESGDSLLLIDQHAAWERIKYEKLIRQMASGNPEIQQLSSPLLIQLTPQEMLLWEEIKSGIDAIGFSITAWDKQHIAVHACPLAVNDPKEAVLSILSGEKSGLLNGETLARRACKQSPTAGFVSTAREADYMKSELIKCSDPFICPHGRPTVIRIGKELLLKEFLRT